MSRRTPIPSPSGLRETSAYTSQSCCSSEGCNGGKIAVTPSCAHHLMLRSDDANGWKIGGCGFCTGFGTTETLRTMPLSTPPPHFAVASSVHGVSPGGTLQYLPLYERKS